MLWNIFYWVFGVATCAYYALETIAQLKGNPFICSFFVPLLLIPLINFLSLLKCDAFVGENFDLRWLAPLQSFAVALSFVLLVVLSPLIILGCVGTVICIIVFPVTLLPLYFVCVAVGPFLTSIKLYSKLKSFLPPGSKMPGFSRPTCLAIVLTLLLIGLFPTALTRQCSAAARDPATKMSSLLLLRAIGDQDTMLKACYNQFADMPWYFSMFGKVLQASESDPFGDDIERSGSGVLSSKDKYTAARELFYRIKGQPFNSIARPNTGEAEDYYYSSDLGDYYWINSFTANDRDFAGDTVGGIVKGLSLSKSEIACAVDANEALAKMRWKMHFHNNDSRHTELRGQILLPPHATVTGCSLWINGIKNEAIISERDSGRQAYEASAIKGERPLLVSTAGAGRVLLQSSMGSWGKDAELDVEITAPLAMIDKTKAALPLPVFSERNFAIGCDHDIKIQSRTAIESKLCSGAGKNKIDSSAGYNLISKLTNSEITSNLGAIVFSRDPAITSVQSASDLAFTYGSVSKNKTAMLQETFVSERLPGNMPIAIVIDGSGSMREMDAICSALAQSHFKDASLIWASDDPVVLASHLETSSPAWLKALDVLRDCSCLGGQDNGAALARALQIGGANNFGVNVVWFHAPQPVAFAGNDLSTLIDKSKGAVKLYEYQVEPGPNVVIKSLDRVSALEQVPRIAGTGADMQSLLQRLAGEKDNVRIVRDIAAKNNSALVSKYPLQIAQLEVLDSVFQNLSDQNKTSGTKLAMQYHLVTPLTSALVLETAKTLGQYSPETTGSQPAVMGSAPANASKNPFSPMVALGEISAKPEPPVSLLMLVAILISVPILWKFRRKKAIV